MNIVLGIGIVLSALGLWFSIIPTGATFGVSLTIIGCTLLAGGWFGKKFGPKQ